MSPRAKKIVRNIIFLLSIPTVIGAFVFAQVSTREEIYQGLMVHIENPELSFVTEEDIAKMVEEQGVLPQQLKTANIDIKKLEDRIQENKWVEDADIFIGANSVMHLNIVQRTPVIRIQLKDSSTNAYYLDALANPIELSEQYVAKVPVVTTMDLDFSRRDLDFKTNLVHLAKVLTKDTFWNAATSQIDVDDKQQLTLIPAIGNQRILLGTPDNLEDKFARLFAFYKNGINSVDWSLYDEIDARFKGQVVCRNSKGMILAEDPYETADRTREREQIKSTIEKEKVRVEKEKVKADQAKAKKEMAEAKAKAKEEKEKEREKAKQEQKKKSLPNKNKTNV